MSLPASRNSDYSPAAPVKSQDLNDIQDCIVGGKHGDVTLCADAADAVAVTGSPSYDGTSWTFGPVSIIDIPLRKPEAGRVKSVTFYWHFAGAQNVTLEIKRRNVDGTAPDHVAEAQLAPAAGDHATTVDVPPGQQRAGGMLLRIYGNSGDRFYRATYVVDSP